MSSLGRRGEEGGGRREERGGKGAEVGGTGGDRAGKFSVQKETVKKKHMLPMLWDVKLNQFTMFCFTAYLGFFLLRNLFKKAGCREGTGRGAGGGTGRGALRGAGRGALREGGGEGGGGREGRVQEGRGARREV